MLLGLGLGLDRAVAHPVAANDQIDQHPKERQEDQEEHPNGLRHTRQLMVAKEVPDYRNQNPDPGEEQKELEDEEQSFTKADVCEQHGHTSRSGQLTVNW